MVSWPGLVDTYLNYMHKEVAENKRQLDAAALKVFKSIFSAADSAERCGECLQRQRQHQQQHGCGPQATGPRAGTQAQLLLLLLLLLL